MSVALLDEFRPGATAAVTARVPPEALRMCLDCPEDTFVSAEHHHHIPRAILDELGPLDGHAFFRFSVARHLRSSHWAWLLRAVDRFFGVSPGRFVHAVPRGFPMVYRDFGRAEVVEVVPQHAILDVLECHPCVFEWPEYVESWRGFVAGFFDVTHHDGEATAQVDPDQRRVRYHLCW